MIKRMEPGGYRMERMLDTDAPAVRISGWARWQVVDEAGDPKSAPVGLWEAP